MERCDLRTERECSCRPTECRVQRLGTFVKPRPAPYDTTTPQYALLGLFVLLAAYFVWVLVAAPAFERVKAENQETAQWQ